MKRILLLSVCLNILLATFASAQSYDYKSYAVLEGHVRAVQNIRFSPDGQTLASTGLNNLVFLWDVQTGKQLHKLEGHIGAVYEATFSNDGSMVATAGDDGTVKVWDVKTGKQIADFEGKPFYFRGTSPYKSITFVCFSPDDKNIFFAGDAAYIMKADLSAPGEPAKDVFSLHSKSGAYPGKVTGGCIGPTDKTLLVSLKDMVVSVNIESHELDKVFVYPGEYGLNDVIAGPYPNQISTWSSDGKVSVWNFDTKEFVRRVQVTTPSPRNYSAASFSYDNYLLVTSASGSLVKVWDWKKGVLKAQLRGHEKLVRTSRFSPTDNIIATASYDGTVRLWKLEGEEPVADKGETPETPETPEEPETPETPEEPETPEVREPVKNDTVVVREVDTVVVRDTVRIVEREIIRDTVVVEKEVEKTPEKEPESTPAEVIPDGEASISESELEVGKTFNLKNMRFERGTSNMLPAGRPELLNLLQIMKRHPSMKIRLDGHTDNVGKQSINLRLSAERIKVVRDYLISNGIPASRIEARAHGGLRPIADNSKEETRKLNRRVEVTIKTL